MAFLSKKNHLPGIVLLIFFLLIGFHSIAQDQTMVDLKAGATTQRDLPKLDSGKFWKTGGLFNLNIGQGSQKNWAAGGDDFSFSLNSLLNIFSRYKKGKVSWDNVGNFNYGLINTTSQGTRKNDDRLDVTSKVGYAISKTINGAFLANFHSQFSKGYQYNSDTSKNLLSKFMAPGYLLFSLGFDYNPAPGLSIFLSPITTRWIFVHNDSLSLKGSYGVTPGERSKSELGAFGSITYVKNLNPNISYNGRLDLFSNYKRNPQNIDVMMNNLLTFKITKVLAASFELDFIYDDDVKLFGPNHDSPGLQIKQITGIGLSMKM